MNLVEASTIATKVVNELKSHFDKLEIVGSIRRQCDTVHDIDLVGIRKSEHDYIFGQPSLEDDIKLIDPDGPAEAITEGISRYSDGQKIKRFKYQGAKIDLYIANDDTFETLKLIRTGSAEHNTRLATLARKKGLKLVASGAGLCKIRGGIYNNEPEEIVEVVENTEEGILQNLLGRVPKPLERRN